MKDARLSFVCFPLQKNPWAGSQSSGIELQHIDVL